MAHKIIEHIRSVCKDHGIKYTSKQDAKRLGELMIGMNSLIDEIYNILDRHEIKIDFKTEIEKDMLKIHAIDHDLIKLTKELLKEGHKT